MCVCVCVHGSQDSQRFLFFNVDQKYDIDSCLKQMDSCFDLLLPRFDAMEETPLSENSLTSRVQGEFRDRVLSSGGSFVSLGSPESRGSEADMEGVGVATQLESNALHSQQNERSDGKCVPGVCGEVGEGEGREGGRGGEEEKGRKKGVDVGKGKGKAVVQSESGEGGEGGDVSSDESDVEWVEVEPIHTASLAPMRQNGFVGQGLSIPIHIPVQVSRSLTSYKCMQSCSMVYTDKCGGDRG